MMDSTLSYSGINTKVKAMHPKLISSQDFQKMSNLESVPDLISYLKKHPGYQDILQKYDEHEIHRSEAERIFINGLYWDYTKIYRFANDNQRKDLDLVFFRYEVNILKACIRLIHNNETAYDLSIFHPFFSKHSEINVTRLSSSHNREEYVQNLKGTQYYSMLMKLSNKTGLSSFDYEMALDVYYFSKSWKLKDKLLKGDSLKAFTERMGAEIDMLNIMWIYRSKRNYDINPADIFTYLIPVNYRLTMAQLSRLVGSLSLEEFFNLLNTTKYKSFIPHLRAGTMEQEYTRVLDRIYQQNVSRYPASMSVVTYYLFRKDTEIKRLITVLECIRYGLDDKKKQDYILY